MPIALCRPVISFFCARKVIVTSPGFPPCIRGGTGILNMEDTFLEASHLGRVTTFSGSKYFQPFITFAAAGAASIRVFPPLCGS